ncbi:MAG: DnaJ-class molecular chaperone [Bacillariaceae sp.]|jgi:DnaJ-class molecular chaperone
MKKLSPIVAVAACATSTAASTAASTTVLPTTTTTDRIPWVVNNFPRGGDEGDNKKNSSSNKSKKSSSSPNRSGKKKKSTKTKQDEKAQTKNKINNSNPILEEILQREDFYDVLGVPNTASERDIQKAYRKRCVQTHPDKTGGDRRAFDKVAEAYEVLSDPSKRQVYNRFGKAGMDPTNNGNSGASPFGGGGDGAAAMFRDMFQQARQQQQRRNQTLRYQLEVTLEDLYFGRTRSVQVTPPHHRHNYQQQRKRKEVDVHISKGSVNGQSVVLSGEVDFNDDNSPPGDLVFILTQVPHATFTRKGHDLAMELNVSLEEALCGLRRSIKHLDGTEMWIESANYSDDQNGKNKSNINKDKDKTDNLINDDDDDDNSNRSSSIPITIRTGDVQVLKGRGMPKRNTNDEFGDLYIQYRVDMPKSKSGKALTEEEYRELSRLLTKLDEHGGGNDRRNRKSMSRRHNKDEQQQQPEIKPKMYSLKEAKPSDFGTASGKVVWEDEDGMGGDGGSHDNRGDEFHQFGSSFFQRGSSASGSPFGGMGGGFNPDDGNVQCQQM